MGAEGRSDGDPLFRRVTVLGPGLLGGSVLLALRRPPVRVGSTVLWARRPEAVQEAAARGVADCCTADLAEAVRGSDLVLLCTPIGVMGELAARMADRLEPGCLVTDVGSVKAPVVTAVEAALRGRARFVGSHPMAGSEQAGLAAARADLFEGAVCIVTPGSGSDPEAVERVGAFWALLGGVVRQLDPATHDRVIARASHLPHLVASALVNSVCGTRPDPLQFIGNGFRDTTRVASGPADLWREILAFNRAEVGEAITGMISVLEQVRLSLETSDDGRLEAFLASAKAVRDGIGQGRGHGGV